MNSSMRQDLREALSTVKLETTEASAAADKRSHQRSLRCLKCQNFPEAASKHRYCGRCETAPYCGQQCARADWAKHKLACDGLRRGHDQALAEHEGRGGRRRNFRQDNHDVSAWFLAVPGLTNEIQLLAWKNRDITPFIYVSTSQSDVDGSGIRIQMRPRSIWNDPQFLDAFPDDREILLRMFGEPSFSSQTHYVCAYSIKHQGGPAQQVMATYPIAGITIRGVEIVNALSAATRDEDLAAAFAWLEEFLPSASALHTLQFLRCRSTLLHGNITQQGSVPISTRAINNDVAFIMIHYLQLEFRIRLTGLHGAVQLNGRQGVLCEQDPSNNERWTAHLDDGIYVSVKSVNFVHINRGHYKRRSL